MSGVLVWIGVGVLGGTGALLRFLLDGTVSRATAARFPSGTLAVNVSGALVLGVLSGIDLDGDALLLAGTALVGAYTTFSTWMLESHRAAEEGRFGVLTANVAGSLALGLLAVLAGRAIGGLW